MKSIKTYLNEEAVQRLRLRTSDTPASAVATYWPRWLVGCRKVSRLLAKLGAAHRHDAARILRTAGGLLITADDRGARSDRVRMDVRSEVVH